MFVFRCLTRTRFSTAITLVLSGVPCLLSVFLFTVPYRVQVEDDVTDIDLNIPIAGGLFGILGLFLVYKILIWSLRNDRTQPRINRPGQNLLARSTLLRFGTAITVLGCGFLCALGSFLWGLPYRNIVESELPYAHFKSPKYGTASFVIGVVLILMVLIAARRNDGRFRDL